MAQNNAKIHGLTAPAASFVGKDLIWIGNVSDFSDIADQTAAIQEVQQVATVMIIGQGTNAGLVLGVEGKVPSGWTQLSIAGLTFVD